MTSSTRSTSAAAFSAEQNASVADSAPLLQHALAQQAAAEQDHALVPGEAAAPARSAIALSRSASANSATTRARRPRPGGVALAGVPGGERCGVPEKDSAQLTAG